MFLPATGDRTPRRIPVGERPVIAASGARIVSANGRGDLEILELPTMVTWTLPRMYTAPLMLSMSPTGHRLYQILGRDAALWTIPEAGSDVAAWLDELTNATEVDRAVHWPWQQATP